MFSKLAVLRRAYQAPLAWVSLAVDLLPILAVFAFGWGAAPLVALYWLENVIIGAVTLARMLATGFYRVQMFAVCLFAVPFFLAHYGLFCYGHGLFLRELAQADASEYTSASLIEWALGAGAFLPLFAGAILALNAVYFVVDYIGQGEARAANPLIEMFRPYDRILILHFALILGAMFAFGSDDPLLGVFLLLAIRIVYGLFLTMRRRVQRDTQLAEGAPPQAATP